MDRIKILTCGGTIDKDYGEGRGVYDFHIGKPCVGKILEEIGFEYPFEVEEVMSKDSLDMTDEDRTKLREAVLSTKEELILITHGTDTMVESGKVIGRVENKTIILTGASRPYSMKITDAAESIKYAIRVLVEFHELGLDSTFIAMNGVALPFFNAQKLDDGTFRAAGGFT